MSERRAAEDQKLVTLARATRARTGAAEGAAVRDTDGRTYAGATVDLPSLSVSALGVCVAMAVVVGVARPGGGGAAHRRGSDPEADLAVLRDFGGDGVVVHVADIRGDFDSTVRTRALE